MRAVPGPYRKVDLSFKLKTISEGALDYGRPIVGAYCMVGKPRIRSGIPAPHLAISDWVVTLQSDQSKVGSSTLILRSTPTRARWNVFPLVLKG